MKSNLLRGPLVKSGAVLLIFSMLVYFTSTSAEGSVWASIGMVIGLIFGLIKWAIGMVIGLVVCIGVLIGIFLGAVAVVNRDLAGDMYDALRVALAGWLTPALAALQSSRQNPAAAAAPATTVEDLKAEAPETAPAVDKELSDLSAKLQAQEDKSASFATGTQLAALTADVNSSSESLAKIEAAVAALQEGLEEVSKQVGAITPDSLLGDMPARIEQLEKQPAAEVIDLQPLEAKISALQDELAAVRASAAESKAAEKPATVKAAPAESREEEHRLLAYFDNDADKQKLVELVEATLKKDMTYAQVMEHLAKQMGKEKGKVITEHPSLAKDFIRLARRA